jgi:HisA/HisF family protein
MKIIPVIDLMRGVAVRAVAGRRDNYRPLETPLASSNAPEAVVAGFLRLHPFAEIYLADLDAILRRGENCAVIRTLCGRFPNIQFWLDAGRAEPGDAPCMTVIGSESLASNEPPPDFSREARLILSLDFRGDDFLGPPGLLSSPQLWPRRVIVMTLARVGMGEGPDLERLAALKAKAGGREIFAAGGVRGVSDLEALSGLGVAGALVASALHDGRLGTQDLAKRLE